MELFNYQILFSVVFEHDYYKKGISSDFSVIPTSYTNRLLSKSGMLFKNFDSGFHILGDTIKQGTDYKLKKEFNDDLKFTFLLKSTNKNFMSFTDIPINKEKNEVFYFNNLTDFESSGNLYLINKDEIPKTSSNNSLIKLSPRYYNYVHSASGDSKTAILSFIDDGITLNDTFYANNGQFNVQFDLGNYHQGRCELNIDGITETFYSINEYSNESIFGVVEIFIKNTVPSNYQFIDTGYLAHKKEYIIPFSNRNTIWRYFVYDKITNTLANPSITMSGREFKLETETTTEYPDKYNLYKFTSVVPGDVTTEEKIPLTEEKINGIKLHGEINGNNKDIILNLPNPDIRFIKPDITDNSKIFTDIIIYV